MKFSASSIFAAGGWCRRAPVASRRTHAQAYPSRPVRLVIGYTPAVRRTSPRA